MAIICLSDFVIEVFNIVPNWRRRMLLIFDEIITIRFNNNELWYAPVFVNAFDEGNKDKLDLDINQLMDEYMLVKEYYGIEMIEIHIASLKQNKMERSQFLRSLKQHDEIIRKSKKKLPYFYGLKIIAIIYWIFARDNLFNVIISGVSKLRR